MTDTREQIVDNEQLHVAFLVLKDRYMKADSGESWEQRIKAGLLAAMPHLTRKGTSHG